MYSSSSTQQPAAICALKSPADAIHILEAVRLGLVPRVTRRLTGHERAMIRPGTIWVWEEEETNMRRWTDGRRWGASRVGGGGFLVYTESSDSLSPPPSRSDSPSYNNGYYNPRKAESLIKQTYSTTMTHPVTGKVKKFHVVAYSSKHNPQGDGNSALPLPHQLPLLANLKITPGIWPEWEHQRSDTFRRPPSGAPMSQSAPVTAIASPGTGAGGPGSAPPGPDGMPQYQRHSPDHYRPPSSDYRYPEHPPRDYYYPPSNRHYPQPAPQPSQQSPYPYDPRRYPQQQPTPDQYYDPRAHLTPQYPYYRDYPTEDYTAAAAAAAAAAATGGAPPMHQNMHQNPNGNGRQTPDSNARGVGQVATADRSPKMSISNSLLNPDSVTSGGLTLPPLRMGQDERGPKQEMERQTVQ